MGFTRIEMTLDPQLAAKCHRQEEKIKQLEDGIKSIIDNRLNNYTDKQYGKGELKALLPKKTN
jgi:hypothetical protein